jgi:hypothetical protein
VSATCGGQSSVAAAWVRNCTPRIFRSQLEPCRRSINLCRIAGHAGEPSVPHFTVDMTVRDYELDQYGVGYYLLTSQSCRAAHHVQYSHTLLH